MPGSSPIRATCWAPAAFLDALNRASDPARRPFRIVERFDVMPKPGIVTTTQLEQLTAVLAADGPYALYEFTQALPRAKLYANWQIHTNDQAVLSQLAATSFDPERTVFVAGGVPPLRRPSEPTITPAQSNLRVTPRKISCSRVTHLRLRCCCSTTVLIQNWKVRVDGKPEPLLRCNYIMRGVYLAPGAHTVEFRFQPPLWPLYISLAAVVLGVVALGFVVVGGRQSYSPAPAPAPNR